jgi:hypothetical protein
VKVRWRALVLGVAHVGLAGGCAQGAARPEAARPHALRAAHASLRAPDDPTVRPARLLPESLDETRSLGADAASGERAIVAGVRIASYPDGMMLAAADRLPSAPASIVALPARLGGGYLFALGAHLWRASSWLASAAPLYTFSAPIAQVQVGLDRVYVRSAQGVLAALDPRSGAHVDLGPLPAAPSVERVAALDAWRAVAVADLRGALVTLDAGSTWRPLGLPIDPSELVTLPDAIAIGGLDEGRQMQWWEVRPDGQATRLPGAPSTSSSSSWSSSSPPSASSLSSPSSPSATSGPGERGTGDAMARPFGRRPLVAALEDGWPLLDGTALVARDGALGIVRLSDGALVETSPDAFALKPSRCHPLPLARAGDPGAFGFVCGEPRGRTIVYRWDAGAAQLVELRRFDEPREVLGSGNGALAVRGPCAAGAPAREDAEQAYCIMRPGAAWSEMRFRGEDVEAARIVVLGDGRVALVRPPHAGDLSSARLTVTDGEHATHLPLALPALRSDVARVLRLGVWMDGFEERRPGVLGGWVEGAGSVVGVEIGVDGETRVGEYIRDAGAPVVSGRWGFGWTASRRGFETTDGGMTWTKDLDLPEPIAPSRAVRERACGPVGCIAAGWLRIGWGWAAGDRSPPAEAPATRPPRTHAAATLELDCQPLGGRQPEPAAEPAGRAPRGWSAALATMGSYGVLSAFPPFYGAAPPRFPRDQAGLMADVPAGTSRQSGSLGHVRAWGPRGGDWDQLGRWEVSWLWPWGGWPDVRSSPTLLAPWPSAELARRALAPPVAWTLASGDDPDHALLVARRPGTAEVFLLESGRAPVGARRPGGEPFADLEDAIRVGDRWYMVTAQLPGELPASVLWLLDGPVAREVARVPRSQLEAHRATRLARRADGRAVGLVVDGHADADRATTTRWVLAIDLESGAISEPEPLAPTDLSDRAVSLCTGEDAGWVLTAPFAGAVRVHLARWEGPLAGAVARLRLTRERACVERAFGSVDAGAGTPVRGGTGAGASASAGTGEAGLADALARSPTSPPLRTDARTIDIGVSREEARYALRCSLRR